MRSSAVGCRWPRQRDEPQSPGVYFSRTGYTKRVAERLGTALDAQLCQITEPKSRLGFLGYSRCLWEASMGRDAAIAELRQLTGQEPLATLALTDATDASVDHEYTDWNDVEAFVDEFLAAAEIAGARRAA